MAGSIAFVAFQVILFGITNAQCPKECNDAKIFAAGTSVNGIDLEGTWHLKNPKSVNCPQEWPKGSGTYVDVCKYRRNDDGMYFCFCDDGDLVYEDGEDWVGGLCYNNVPPIEPILANYPSKNSYAYCMKECVAAHPNATYFGMADGDGCYCGNVQPFHPVNPLNCNIPCPADQFEMCGGTNFINIWAIPKKKM